LGAFTEEKESTVNAIKKSYSIASATSTQTTTTTINTTTNTTTIITTNNTINDTATNTSLINSSSLSSSSSSLSTNTINQSYKITRISKVLAEPKTLQILQNEIKVYERLKQNPVFQTPYQIIQESDYIYIIYQEKRGQKNLLQILSRVKQLKEDIAREIFKKMIHCVHECHKNNIIHRDIKLPAFFIEEDSLDVHLGELRYSTIVPSLDQSLTDRRGSPAYVPPEVIQGLSYNGVQADYWSLGVVLYTMTCGSFPFNASNPRELFQSILKDSLVFPQGISSDLKSLLKLMLEKDPSNRASYKSIIRHPWLVSSSERESSEDQIVPDF